MLHQKHTRAIRFFTSKKDSDVTCVQPPVHYVLLLRYCRYLCPSAILDHPPHLALPAIISVRIRGLGCITTTVLRSSPAHHLWVDVSRSAQALYRRSHGSFVHLCQPDAGIPAAVLWHSRLLLSQFSRHSTSNGPPTPADRLASPRPALLEIHRTHLDSRDLQSHRTYGQHALRRETQGGGTLRIIRPGRHSGFGSISGSWKAGRLGRCAHATQRDRAQ